MLLAVGFLVFTLIYLVYSMTSLGRINTLPPLPDKYIEGKQGSQRETIVEGPRMPTPLERKLEMAFRPGCEELKWPVRLELNSRSMVMAAEDFKVETDGRVLLEHMSLALFGKKKNDGRDIEINTLRCKRAFITFDRPVSSLSPSELNGRKVVAADLLGEGQTPIVIENNRRTSAHDDDLTVTINTGPLHYDEKKQFIWTRDIVHLRDGWLEPPRADILAKGMEMELATSAPPPRPGAPIAPKPKNETISGVKRVVLNQDVTMHLHIAGGTPFPGGDKKPPAVDSKTTPSTKTAADKPAEPSHIIIRTPGRFQYDLFKDHDMARFDVPDESLSRNPQDVTVVRVNKDQGHDQLDQLVCKHLELRVKRRGGDAPPTGKATPATQSAEQGLEIETAHATGPDVTLTSDLEKLDAHGNDFFYDATKKLTILKGTPFMEANKDESLIQAPELRIQEIPLSPAETGTRGGNAAKSYQQVQATGPGKIHLINKTTGKKSTHASWNKHLISKRECELDLLVLVGAASLEDEEQKLSLKADTINVWLLAEDAKPNGAAKKPAAKSPATAKAPTSPQQSRRPDHIEALRNVTAHSRELHIHDTSRLVVRFTDVPAERMPPPSAGQKNQKQDGRPQSSGTVGPPPATSSIAAKPASGSGALPDNSNKAATPPKGPEPDRPIDLTARDIEADVLRCEERMALDHLHAQGGSLDTKGGVEVRQEPAKPGERGVYIKGNDLSMKCTPEGNILDVTGDLAQLEMDKIIIIGPEVRINQASNKAEVQGQGAMQMQSDQTLEGKPLGRTVPLTIHWSQDMVFFGESAEFRGGIQAEQENARLACQHLQVFFDRPISLKQGVRGDQPAKVRNLVGDREVRVEDKTIDHNRLQKYQRLEGISINMNTVPRDEDAPPLPSPQPGKAQAGAKRSDANEVVLSGPGSVRLMQRGGSDVNAPPGRPTPASQTTAAKKPADEQQMKLTYVRFDNLMKASSRTNTASFWGSVRVLNFPCEDPYHEIDLDAMIENLPEGGMYMRCDRLKALTQQRQGRTYQEMEADGQVIVRSREFFAQSNHMTFNEEKDQVILTGDRDHPAVLQKRQNQGATPQVFRARKIIYIRKTGQAKVDDGDSFDG
jgi:lipopolysaccharide export system protein LptA